MYKCALCESLARNQALFHLPSWCYCLYLLLIRSHFLLPLMALSSICLLLPSFLPSVLSVTLHCLRDCTNDRLNARLELLQIAKVGALHADLPSEPQSRSQPEGRTCAWRKGTERDWILYKLLVPESYKVDVLLSLLIRHCRSFYSGISVTKARTYD